MPLTVTFDTNALNDAVWPDKSQRPTDPADAARVRAAIQAGDIRGFFSETVITLEGIQKKDRADVLGSVRLECKRLSTDRNTVVLELASKMNRRPLESTKFSSRIHTAR